MASQPHPRDLPPGCISPIDSQTNRPYYVDTRVTPPRIMWTHPYLDEEYLKANPILTRDGAQHRPVPDRGFGSPPIMQSPLQQPQLLLPDPSPSANDNASSARPSYQRGETFPMSSSGSDNRRFSFTPDSSSSSRSMSLPAAPKKRVLKKRRNPGQDLGAKPPPPQADTGLRVGWDNAELPYQITPFVPPPRPNPAQYSLPTSPVSASSPPGQFYPVDSKLAEPSSYETKMSEKQRLMATQLRYEEEYRMKNTPVPITHSQQQMPYPASGNAPSNPAYPFPNRPPPSNVFQPPSGVGGLLPPRYTTNDMNYGNGNSSGGGHQGVQGAYYNIREKGGRRTY